MCKNNENTSVLLRGGQSQQGRINEKLLPQNVKIDDRSITDFILFARKYSKYIKYYDQNNTESGDWEDFWSKDISAVLAYMSGFPIDDYRQFYIDLRNHIIELASDLSLIDSEIKILDHLRLFFQLPVLLIKRMQNSLDNAGGHLEVRDQIEKLLEKEINDPLGKIVAHYMGALEPGIALNQIDDSLNWPASDTDDYITLPDFVTEMLPENASFDTADINIPGTGEWSAFITSTIPDSNPYLEANSIEEAAFDAMNYSLFTSNFESVINAMSIVTKLFRDQLEQTLTNDPSHSPHIALWIVFAKLYQFQKEEINTLPRKHLEFYYRDVLQQCLKEPVPNRTHVIFELDKDVDKHLIKRGTLLDAGKDEDDNDVNYQVLDEILVTKTQVADIKSFYQSQGEFPIGAKKANSKDGIEANLDEDNPAWRPFYNGQNGDPNSKPKARLGIALADKNLFMREGSRTVSLNLGVDLTSNSYHSSSFEVYYTGEKSWVKLHHPPLADILDRVDNGSSPQIIPYTNGFRFVIDSENPACVHFDPSIHVTEEHPDQFQTGLPIMKIVFVNRHSNWKNLNVSQIKLSVKVDGIKNVYLQNKNGSADTSKSFPLFGAIPDSKPYVILGNNEIFSKSLTNFTANFEWAEPFISDNYYPLPSNNLDADLYTGKLEYLSNGKWINGGDIADSFFDEGGASKKVDLTSSVEGKPFRADQTMENEEFTNNSRKGFIKLTLDENFGHLEYPNAFTSHVISAAGPSGDGDVNFPEPYKAELSELRLSYTSEANTPSSVFHLHPFGYKKVNNPNKLIPTYDNDGELYIGLKDLNPVEKLHVLFQLQLGTSNPLAEIPNVKWSYLKNNQWSDSGLELEDRTNGMIDTGIIAFNIPKGPTDNNTLLPKGYHWLRMSLDSDNQSLSSFISVDAQAAVAEFLNNDNSNSFLETPLEPNTITDLRDTSEKIKKVVQKYHSFYGSALENADKFYTRVSERLRHKNRAIQLWDYEHMVLQQFPNIYRVKCLNHTKVDDSNRPGNVTLVPVPNVSSKLFDPLKPYPDLKSRTEIHRFVKERISPFVCLHVVEPKLESIQIECNVIFKNEIVDQVFYVGEVKRAILEYLTPWAFYPQKEVDFGGVQYKSDIINLIDELPYVDYIKDLKMFHHPDIENKASSASTAQYTEVEVVYASTQRSILVSDKNHQINHISNSQTQTSSDESCFCHNNEVI